MYKTILAILGFFVGIPLGALVGLILNSGQGAAILQTPLPRWPFIVMTVVMTLVGLGAGVWVDHIRS
jgi:hypothetical protein